jgi:hypothetical protein
LALSRRQEFQFNLPFAHLLRAEILFKRDSDNPAPAEEAFQTAIAVAREQGARSWGLRAALSFAKLYQSTGRPVEAYDVLASALEGFMPTLEMSEIAEGNALLVTLAQHRASAGRQTGDIEHTTQDGIERSRGSFPHDDSLEAEKEQCDRS